MKKAKKIILVALSILLVTSVMVACGGNSGTEASQAPASSSAPSASQSSDETASGGTLRMGTNAAFPPFEYKEGDGFAGIDVEICQEIAKKLGKDFEVVDMEFDALLPAVNSGKCDIVAAGMTVDPDREKEVDFTGSYYTSTQVIIVQKDNESITSQEDLKNLKLGAQSGTTGEEAIKNIEGAELLSYQNGMEAVLALKNGQIDAIVIDSEPAKNFVENNSEDLKLVEAGFPEEYYAIAVKKGDTELLEDIEAALQELKDDGTIDSIIEKYIQ